MIEAPIQSLGEEYFIERMHKYGITDEVNRVQLWQYDSEKKDNVLIDEPIFTACERGIEILVYDLDRNPVNYKGEGSRWSKDFKIIRLHTPEIGKNGREKKYHIPKGAGTHPFFPPQLIEKFQKKEKIKTLVATEGYFKAFNGAMHGLDIIAFSSITHYKDKEKGTIHPDIVRIIKDCKVENFIWLADGDCNRISLKALNAGDDIAKRPNQFFNSCTSIKRLLDDYDIHKYFAYVDSMELDGMPKGLDDLLLSLPGHEPEIISDLLALSKPGKYFFREDMSYSTNKIRQHFKLHNVSEFVEFHSEMIRKIAEKEQSTFVDLKTKEFVWNGTKYRWDESKSECKVVVPGDSKRYFRVGDVYHEKIEIPNKYSDLEKTFHRRQKTTIVDDYGKEFIKHVPKYKAFCNVPDHSNYQEILHSCYNMYYPFEHEPEPGDYSYTMRFLKHIFGEKEIKVKHKEKGEIIVTELDLGLDYIQILYQQPQQILPILCLVSHEQGTGKTTFAKFLKMLFTQNVAVVGNAELANDFNASWAGKLLVICDEAKIDKQVVVERVKSLSTGDKIFMNSKGKDHVEIDFFAKFLFMTNNEENFIYAGEDDVRYWIRKVPVIAELFIGLLEEMKTEIPAFLDFLNKRKLKTEKLHRAWFYPELIKTEALKKVIAHNESTVVKELRERIRNMFYDHGGDEILLTMDAINEHFFKNKYEVNYLRKSLQDKLKLQQYHEFVYDKQPYMTVEAAKTAIGESFDPDKLHQVFKIKRHAWPKWESKIKDGHPSRERVYVKDVGRPYVFKIKDYLTAQELESRGIDAEAENDHRINQNNPPAPEQITNSDDLPF